MANELPTKFVVDNVPYTIEYVENVYGSPIIQASQINEDNVIFIKSTLPYHKAVFYIADEISGLLAKLGKNAFDLDSWSDVSFDIDVNKKEYCDAKILAQFRNYEVGVKLLNDLGNS
ncbi:hypothetical protein [Weissella viridescens]|uniref:hypothetical protein n=1 Tax=Weissella viridescens TaxID=1629 RepID=UPI0022E91D45|nr:hypothetical protein [Weissella viridescens]